MSLYLRFVTIFSLLIFFPVAADEVELVVPLSTKSLFVPVEVQSLHLTPYQEKLKELFLEDIELSASMKEGPSKNHVVKLEKKDKSILFRLNGKLLGEVTSTGSLHKDRKEIHYLTNLLHQNIFKKSSIFTSKILYALQIPDNDTGKYSSEIWECDFDGENPKRLTFESSYCITPAMIPHSDQFLYVNYKLGQPKIYISRLGEKRGKEFIKLRGNQLLPELSSNGRKLAFISDASGRADLFVQDIDPQRGLIGKPIQAYSFPHSVQASPTFNPTGTKIAFVSDKGGTPRVYLIETPIGQYLHRRPDAICLTTQFRENTCPTWSPDGNKIAYSARIGGVRQIMIYDLESDTEYQLTKGQGHKENPKWATTSLHIVYNEIDNETSDLYLIDINRKTPKKILSGFGKKHYPVWRKGP